MATRAVLPVCALIVLATAVTEVSTASEQFLETAASPDSSAPSRPAPSQPAAQNGTTSPAPGSTAASSRTGATGAIGATGAPATGAAPGKAVPPLDAAKLAAPPDLRIAAPKPTEIVTGQVKVVVAGSRLAAYPEVEILVDGQPAGRLTGHPYELTIDFGSSLAPKRITARIVGADGSVSAQTEITTRGFDESKIDQVARVDLVTLYVTVRSSSGKYVTDLDQEQFKVFDQGKVQSLTHFGMEHRPLAAAIVLDSSYSMKGDPMDAARASAIRFVKSLEPDDRAMVVAFSDEPQILCDLTADRAVAEAAIKTVQAKGGTALYDTIYTVSERLAREDGRKVIILLSDGRDEAQSGIEPGSLHTFEEALEKSLRSEVIMFTIGFGKKLAEERDFYGRTSLKDILDRLALDSGGSSYYPQRTSQLKSAYELISEELRNQYSLAYSPLELRTDGTWHTIRVDLKDPALKAFTRRGYYAAKH